MCMRRAALVIAGFPLLLSGCHWGRQGQASPHTTRTAMVSVPTVTPIYTQDAERLIRGVGLRVVIAGVPPITGADASSNGYAVRSQSPAAGTHVPAGTAVLLSLAYSVNAGPGGVGRPGVVPDLVGMPVNRAMAAATSVGLHVTVRAVKHHLPNDSVTAQSLPQGSRVEPGEVITITLG